MAVRFISSRNIKKGGSGMANSPLAFWAGSTRNILITEAIEFMYEFGDEIDHGRAALILDVLDNGKWNFAGGSPSFSAQLPRENYQFYLDYVDRSGSAHIEFATLAVKMVELLCLAGKREQASELWSKLLYGYLLMDANSRVFKDENGELSLVRISSGKQTTLITWSELTR